MRGSTNISNTCDRKGVELPVPVRHIQDLDFDWLGTPATIGLTAGASAPEQLVREVVDALSARFSVIEDVVETTTENMVFKLPRGLEAA